MKRLTDRSTFAVLMLALAWAALFVRQYLQAGWIGWLPVWVPALIAAAAVVLAYPRIRLAGRHYRAAVVGAGLLIVVAGLLLYSIKKDSTGLEDEWRESATREITAVVGAVGERIEQLLDLSTEAGEQTKAFVRAQHAEGAESMDFRLEAFRELNGLAERFRKGKLVPSGTEIGIQLFDASGNRVAWAGWPQTVEPLDDQYIASGREMIYSRQVSLYRILTHIIPVYSSQAGMDDKSGRNTRGKIATVLVDMPLEVNYKVNNKFLKSSSLADDLARGRAANIRFGYFPAGSGLSASLDAVEREGKPGDSGEPNEPRGSGEPDKPGARRGGPSAEQEPEEDAGALPASVEMLGAVTGTEAAGLGGRAVVRSPLGNALFNMTVVSPPFAHYVETGNNRILFAANLFILIALLIGNAASLGLFPRRPRLVKAMYLVAMFAFVRYVLLWYQPNLLTSQLQIFEPAVFATPILGGLMRSAGDLLITAVFFAAALYGVLKITRDRDRQPAEPAPSGPSWLFALKGFLAGAAIIGAFELAHRFIGSVVLNANPRLIGETVGLFEPQILVLHVSAFLMVGSIFLAGMMCAWGFYRVKGRSATGRASVVAAIVILAVSIVAFQWDLFLISLLVLVFVVFAPRIVQREDLVSIVITAFGFVIIVSAAAYVFFNQEYQGLRRTFIQEKVEEVTHPSDNWKVFILEDILENLAQQTAVKQSLYHSDAASMRRLAFDLWADSPLSLLGYSCAIYVFDQSDSLVSRFEVEMPYRLTADDGARMEGATDEEWVVLDQTTRTAQGSVRFYRGIVNLQEQTWGLTGLPMATRVGKVVIDIPFFFENLTWAARTGPQTPEVLRNVQEGGIAPRLEETEALLLARVRGTRVLESSSEVLPAGYMIDPNAMARAIDLDWPLLATGGVSYRFFAREAGEPASYLLAGFPVPSLMQHVLRWSTILSLYFFFTVALIVLIILLKRLPLLGVVLPTLTPGRQLGFQQKLLGSFLIIALLPAVILGVFTVRMIKDRFVEESRKEAVYRATSANKALGGVLVDELHGLIDRYDLNLLLDDKLPPTYAHDSTYRVRVIPVGDADFGWLLDDVPPEQAFVHRFDNVAYLGVVSHPITIASGDSTQAVIVYCARRADSELLGEIADRVGADVSLFDGGELIAASREGLLSGGFISATMDADAFVKVSVMGVDQTLVTEQAGRYQYQVAYIPVLSTDPDENAAIGVPLLFRPESYSVEVEKATSIVLSIFTLLSAATIGLGLLLARGIFEPLKGLLEGTKRIARGDFSFKLPSGRRDEIGSVVDAFNEMTSQVSESQAALEERRRYLEAILVNIGTGVITTDSNDRIRAANDAAERILGTASGELIGKTTADLVAAGVTPEFFSRLAAGGVRAARAHGGSVGDDSAVVEDRAGSARSDAFGGGGARSDAVDGGEPIESEIDVIKGGQKRTIKYIQTRLSTEGRYLGTVFVFEDLTELISSKKLSAWVEMARQIAHEIKNPLTPIKLSAQFMVRAHQEKSNDFDRIFQESADTIIHQVDVLRNISSEFSSFGRLQQLHLTPRPVIPLLRDIVTPYERNASGVKVSLDVPDGEPTAIVDPEALRKICTNLIENAMESMSGGGGGDLSVVCDVAPVDGEEMVRIVVTDTGSGIDEEAAERLFEPYFSTKTTGTGLGLAICRTLSREMGGDVTVENLPGRAGVKATLYLKPA